MATNYPTGYDSYTTPGATMDIAVPHDQRHINTDDAVEAMQAEYGLSPSAADASVRARLDRIEASSAATTPVVGVTDQSAVRVSREGLIGGLGYVVHLYGRIRNAKAVALAVGDDLFTIPVGYRPSFDFAITFHNTTANTFGTASVAAATGLCEAGTNAAGVSSASFMWFHASWETV